MAGWRTGALPVLLAAVLAGCAAEKPAPAPLAPLTPKIAGQLVWNVRLAGIRMPLQMPVRDGVLSVAGSDGTLLALDVATGRERWRAQAGTGLSAGVGSDGRFAAVVTTDNELVVFEGGVRKWGARLDSRTVTSPFVAGERVFVMGVDRSVHAFDALDGRRLWSYQRPGEALTLAQPGVLTSYRDHLVVGQGAVLVALDPTLGTVRWETAISSPRGTNEVERLNDLIGPALRLGDVICARAFQTAVGCVAANSATLRWSRPVGGIQALGGDADFVFGADGSDRISAWRTSSGELAWVNEKLLRRGLSAPISTGRVVVFGDAEGQLHFLDRANGEALLRLPTDGSPVVAPPVLAGSTVLVATRNGGIFAFRPD